MENGEFGLADSSIQSRLDIFLNSSIDQLAVNPVFGNLAADKIVGHPGYYIHSIVSVQTHLGFIGSVFLFIFILHCIVNLYSNKRYPTLKILTFFIMIVSFIGTFFTWMPLWFLIGSLYSANLNSRLNSGRPS